MAEDCCLFNALNAVICMFIFSSVDNGVTDDHSETSDFIVRFYSFMFSEIFFNMNSFSLKIEMRNRSSLVMQWKQDRCQSEFETRKSNVNV